MDVKLTIDEPGHVYYFILPSHNKRDLFGSVFEYHQFEKNLKEIADSGHLIPIAFCLLPKEIRLVARVQKPINQAITSLTLSFTQWVHRVRHQRGSLFSDQIEHTLVNEQKYLAPLVRHLHQLPVKQGLTPTVDTFRWSSHRHYSHKTPPQWLDVNEAINQMVNQRAHHQVRYQEYMNKTDIRKIDYERGTHPLYRAIGSNQFITQVLSGYQPKPEHSEDYGENTRKKLDGIIDLVSEEYGMEKGVLLNQTRHRLASDAQGLVAWLCVQSNINLDEYAKLCTRDPSLLLDISRGIEAHHPKNYLSSIQKKWTDHQFKSGIN